jgi:hypothetical protein
MPVALRDTVENENGFVLVVAVIMLVAITVIGIAATRTSETEVQIAENEQQIIDDFYNAEGVLINTLENPNTWMPALLTGSSYMGASGDFKIEIRWIDDTDTDVGGLSAAANHLPSLPHRGPPQPGSGYSSRFFEMRRYGVTTTSATSDTQVQAGAWKVFNQYQQ